MNRYNVWNPDADDATSWFTFAESERDAAKQYVKETGYKGKLAVQIVPRTKFFKTEELEGE